MRKAGKAFAFRGIQRVQRARLARVLAGFVSSNRRGNRPRDRADRRRSRMVRQRRKRKKMRKTRFWRKPQTQKAAAQASSRGTWGRLPSLCRRSEPRTDGDIPDRCIRKWACELRMLTPLESICGEFANPAGPIRRTGRTAAARLVGTRTLPCASLAPRRPRANHRQLPAAAQNPSAAGRRAFSGGRAGDQSEVPVPLAQ
jgi:hypothetical protein